jgi:hypothetical protein
MVLRQSVSPNLFGERIETLCTMLSDSLARVTDAHIFSELPRGYWVSNWDYVVQSGGSPGSPQHHAAR